MKTLLAESRIYSLARVLTFGGNTSNKSKQKKKTNSPKKRTSVSARSKSVESGTPAPLDNTNVQNAIKKRKDIFSLHFSTAYDLLMKKDEGLHKTFVLKNPEKFNKGGLEDFLQEKVVEPGDLARLQAESSAGARVDANHSFVKKDSEKECAFFPQTPEAIQYLKSLGVVLDKVLPKTPSGTPASSPRKSNAGGQGGEKDNGSVADGERGGNEGGRRENERREE